MTFQALLFCPDEKTARVTTQVLTELEFSVEPCTEPFAAVKKLMAQHFDAVVVDCENEQNATLLFKSARNSTSNQGALAVAVVEGQAGVANAFRIGANLVLTKPINVEQAKSTLRVARGLLRKGTEAAKAPQAGLTASPTAPPSAAPAETAARPTASTAPRPVTPTAAVARPVTPAPIQKPVAPVFTQSAATAKSTAEITGSRPKVQPPSAAPASAAADIFEAPSPSAGSEPKRVAPQHSFEAAVKPAASASGKVPIQTPQNTGSGASASTSGKVPLFQAKPVLRSGMGPGGAAAAPAPAKENPKPFAPVFQDRPGMLEQSGKPNAATLENLFESGTGRTEAVAAPSFAALDSANESEGSGGNKTAIIVAIAILALAALGYFGYTKFIARKASTSTPAVAPQSQPPTPDGVPLSSNGTGAVQQANTSAGPLSATHAEVGATPHAASAARESDTESEPEVVVTHPAPQKSLSVKSDAAKASSKRTEEVTTAELSAPPVIGSGETTEAGAISSIVQSAPVAMPKVAAPQTVRVSQGVTEGLLIKKVPPTYPRQAIQMHVQGAVQMQAMIDKQGRISGIKVLKGDPTLARAAIEAVNQWRYKPYFLDGQPVDIQTQITVNFKLP
jgi:TonB family protein